MDYEFRKTEHKVYEYDDIIKVTNEEYDKLNQMYKQAVDNTKNSPSNNEIDAGFFTSLANDDIEYIMMWGGRSLSRKFKIEKI